MRTIWYMGAKTRITGAIEEAIDKAAPKATSVLDLMSGTASVSVALAPHLRVVANDVQGYASTIASAYLLHDERSKAAFLRRLDPERDLGAAYLENRAALLELLAPAVAIEDEYLRAYKLDPSAFDPQVGPNEGSLLEPAEVARPRRQVPAEASARARAYRSFALQETPAFLEERDTKATGPFKQAHTLFLRATIEQRRRDPRAFPYLLCSSYYPNVYLGLRQAIDVDSLRYAIDALPTRGHGPAKRRHYLAALLHAASVTTSATSHFCQPRGLVRDPEVLAVLRRRSLSIPARLVGFSASIAATVAATPLQDGNAVRTGPWREAFANWDEVQADVVYADPPYTADNYSRFYHVLEVLTRYDYPELHVLRGRTTKGRYPAIASRHRSPFCVRRGVEGEVRSLIEASAERGAALVFSYGEENGLLFKTYRDAGDSPAQALRRFAGLAEAVYRDVSIDKRVLLHSGQGDSNRPVTELLLIARSPRRKRR